jgi:hypothetical protein
VRQAALAAAAATSLMIRRGAAGGRDVRFRRRRPEPGEVRN